ncbi:MAG: PQQ-like beta-propeller repeat protein [Rhodobacteraceae bacterium]|nr:PQQ-like beta-propeller repeat protein [Paracoccaceae bacterium]
MAVRLSWTLPLILAVGLVSACGQREERLAGDRIGLRDLGTGDPADAAGLAADDAPATQGPAARSPEAPVNRALPAALPPARPNADWTHRNGSAQHRTVHPALSAQPVRVWSADIGQANSRRQRITADPVVAAGRIFTMDAGATITAVSTGGARLWSTDITPGSDRGGEASGGALAYGAGRVFATSGFGLIAALDPESGAVLWTQKLDASATGAPTVVGDRVYLSARDSRGWALSAENGRIEWTVQGTPTTSVMTGGGGPAVTDSLAIFPFGSNELVAALREGGVRVWGASVAGQRRGRVYATISDITGDPVVDGGTVYAGNQSGRAAAFDAESGERLWTATEGAYSPVWPEGNSLYLVSDQSELVRLDAATGERIWGVELPYFEQNRLRRLQSVTANFGPVVAGGRVWVASDDGRLRAFAPDSGALVYETEIPGGAASNPAVAGGVLYVISARGQLHAFR